MKSQAGKSTAQVVLVQVQPDSRTCTNHRLLYCIDCHKRQLVLISSALPLVGRTPYTRGSSSLSSSSSSSWSVNFSLKSLLFQNYSLDLLQSQHSDGRHTVFRWKRVPAWIGAPPPPLNFWSKCTWEQVVWFSVRCQDRQNMWIDVGGNGGIWCSHGKMCSNVTYSCKIWKKY